MFGDALTGAFSIEALATGPDDNVWFDADVQVAGVGGRIAIGNVTPEGQVTEFPKIQETTGGVASCSMIVAGAEATCG